MEYSPALSSRPDWSSVTATVRLVLVGQSDLETDLGTAQAQTFKALPVKTHGLGYKVWHSFLNLILIFVTGVIFAWFGPGLWYSFSVGLERILPLPKNPANSTAQIQPGSQDWPKYLQFNKWFGGLVVTPVAGQSATEPKSAQTDPTPTPTPVTPQYQPPVDASLPDGNWLVIPRIGVRSELQQGSDFEKALSVGLWQVPDFGQAGSRDLPMIVAGHRYGWDWWWKTDYWKYHSFNQLPQLQPGDQVEVIADHRKWLYQVYAGEEGTEITDYSADLILYTCKDLNSPVRFFRYARLVDPTQNSQGK